MVATPTTSFVWKIVKRRVLIPTVLVIASLRPASRGRFIDGNSPSPQLALRLSGNRIGRYLLYELRLNAHRFGNQHEVFFRHPEMTEAKGCTPAGLVLDER